MNQEATPHSLAVAFEICHVKQGECGLNALHEREPLPSPQHIYKSDGLNTTG